MVKREGVMIGLIRKQRDDLSQRVKHSWMLITLCLNAVVGGLYKTLVK